MALLVEDMDEKNWIICESCKNLCKNPNYDYDLKLDECCLCIQTNARCSSCSDRKFIEKNKKKELKISVTTEKNEERHECLSCHNLFFFEEMYDLPAGYYCVGCYSESH